MKVNLKTPIISTNGEIMKEQSVDAQGAVIGLKEVSTKELLIRALTITTKKDEERNNKEKDFTLSIKILQNKEDVIDLEAEETSRLKSKVADIYDVWIMGQLHLILEGKKLEL